MQARGLPHCGQVEKGSAGLPRAAQKTCLNGVSVGRRAGRREAGLGTRSSGPNRVHDADASPGGPAPRFGSPGGYSSGSRDRESLFGRVRQGARKSLAQRRLERRLKIGGEVRHDRVEGQAGAPGHSSIRPAGQIEPVVLPGLHVSDMTVSSRPDSGTRRAAGSTLGIKGMRPVRGWLDGLCL